MAVKKKENTFEQLNRVDVSKFTRKKGSLIILVGRTCCKRIIKSMSRCYMGSAFV